VEEKAWQLIEKIDAMGGSVSAIEQGFIQNEIAKSAYEYQRKIETGEKIIVGVNKFQVKEETPIPLLKIDDNIRDAQVEKIKRLKETRSQEQTAKCLEAVREKAASDENIMPSVIDAVENYCTLGEIADELRKLFGEFK
jgi:methylmalonyl-CoA mutase N-terminal domain/subunit